MRRTFTRRLASLGAACLVMGVVGTVATSAQAAAGKYYSVSSPAAYAYLGLDTTVDVVITNDNKSQSLGSAQVTMPTSFTGYALTWKSVTCTVSTGASCDTSGTDWLLSSTPDNVVTTVETPSNTKAALLYGQSVRLEYVLASVSDATTVASAALIYPGIGVVAKQSNTFNDTGSGNLFTLNPKSPAPALDVTLQPSSNCKGGSCDLAPSGADVTDIAVNGQGDSTQIGLLPSTAGCGADSARPVSQVNVVNTLASKTVTLTWSKEYTRKSNYGLTSWAVCMTAPYALYDVNNGVVTPSDPQAEVTVQLPSCTLSAASGYPCVQDLGRNKGQQFAVVSVPKSDLDPKFF